MNKSKKYPKGTFIALGMLLFVPVGIALALGTDNPGLIGIGPAIGLPAGLAWEEKQRKKGMIISDAEPQDGKKKLFWILFLLGLLAFGILAYFLSR